MIVWNLEPVINDSSRLFARVHGLNNWQEVPLNVILEDSAIGYLYQGDLTSFTTHQRSRLDVKVSGYDQSGNMISHTWEPAVFVGDPATGTREGTRSGLNGRVKAWPNPAEGHVYFEILSDLHATITLRIFDFCGRMVKNFAPLKTEPGRVTIEWNGKNDQGAGLPAGLYFYQCGIGEQKYQGKIVIGK